MFKIAAAMLLALGSLSAQAAQFGWFMCRLHVSPRQIYEGRGYSAKDARASALRTCRAKERENAAVCDQRAADSWAYECHLSPGWEW